MPLIDIVRKTIQDHDLIPRGSHIILGLSGGPDSVCLFHVLQRLAPELDVIIHPVHVNHLLRPGEAERDQAYVEKLCAGATAQNVADNWVKDVMRSPAKANGAGTQVYGQETGICNAGTQNPEGCDAHAQDPGNYSPSAQDPEGCDAHAQDPANYSSSTQDPTDCATRVRPCRSFTVDVSAMAEKLGLTSEEAGRRARYDAFVQVAGELADRDTQALRELTNEGTQETVSGMTGKAPAYGEPCIKERELTNEGSQEPARDMAESWTPEPETSAPTYAQREGLPPVAIAVAQNANDQAETILQRLLRGTGPDGLSGIAYRRYEQGIPVIRPLLDVPRTDIEAYCQEHGLRPVIDHTNTEPVYTRNRIRLELLPLLQEYNPNIISGLARLSRIAAEDRAYLQQQVEEAMVKLRIPGQTPQTGIVVLEREGLSALPSPIRHRLIVQAFAEVGLMQDITEERLQAADAIIHKKQGPKTVQFPHGHSLTVKKGRAILR